MAVLFTVLLVSEADGASEGGLVDRFDYWGPGLFSREAYCLEEFYGKAPPGLLALRRWFSPLTSCLLEVEIGLRSAILASFKVLDAKLYDVLLCWVDMTLLFVEAATLVAYFCY